MNIKTAGLATLVLWIGVSFAAVQAQAGEAHSIWDGIYTKEQAKRGEMIYAENCGACHGADLMGGEFAPALTGLEFNSNWNGLSLGDLFERIRGSMPQDDPSKITPAQKADALAYILSFGKFPAGMSELPRDAQVLQQIKFEATKP